MHQTGFADLRFSPMDDQDKAQVRQTKTLCTKFLNKPNKTPQEEARVEAVENKRAQLNEAHDDLKKLVKQWKQAQESSSGMPDDTLPYELELEVDGLTAKVRALEEELRELLTL
jgi:protein subunit release factor A